jgi:plastocyanin
MRMRRVTALLAGGALVMAGFAAHAATTRSVGVKDFFFDPAALTAAQGDTVRWTSSGAVAHTTTSTITGVVGWNSTLSPGASYSKQLPGAGTYAYRCVFHAGMSGNVRIPVIVAPLSGPLNTIFTITVARAPAPTGFRYAPAVRLPGSTTWTPLSETSATSVSFKATRTGTYSFRSAIKHGSLPGTGPSPAKSVTVS